MKLVIIFLCFFLGVNVRDEFGRTPLHWSCEKGHHEVSIYLVQHGADVMMQVGVFHNQFADVMMQVGVLHNQFDDVMMQVGVLHNQFC